MIGALLGGIVAVGLVVGCSAAGGDSSSASVGVPNLPAAAAPAPAPAIEKAPGTGGTASGSAGQADAAAGVQDVDPLPTSGRQVVRSASIALSVSNVTGTAADVRRITVAAGGYAGTEDTEGDHADFTLQVPEAALDTVVDQLAGLGHVTDRSEQAQDVTDQLVDVRSRVATQQASVARVRALLAQATSISDIVTIEGELATRESDLESLEQRQDELSGQVAMSTVTVHVVRAAPAAPPATTASTGFLGGLSAGWHSFVGVLGGVLVVLGAVLPYLVGLGIPVALVWWLVRRRRGGRVVTAPPEVEAGA